MEQKSVNTLFGAAVAEQRNPDVIERVMTKALQTEAINVGESARQSMARECIHVVPDARVDDQGNICAITFEHGSERTDVSRVTVEGMAVQPLPRRPGVDFASLVHPTELAVVLALKALARQRAAL
jgi:hypothetical protein